MEEIADCSSLDHQSWKFLLKLLDEIAHVKGKKYFLELTILMVMQSIMVMITPFVIVFTTLVLLNILHKGHGIVVGIHY